MAASPWTPAGQWGGPTILSPWAITNRGTYSRDTEHGTFGPAGEEPERIPNNSA
jgi:hypothetical protein